MTMPSKKYQLNISEEAFKNLKEYADSKGMSSLAEAMRDLINKGLWLNNTVNSDDTDLIMEEADGSQYKLKLL
jgi:hypothetical protein